MKHIFPITSIEILSSFIPQRPPIMMVDKLIMFSESTIVGALTVKSENIFVKNNLLQEPGIIEHMAQTVALHTGFDFFLRNEKAPTGYIGSIKFIEIEKLPKVNDEIITEVTIIQEFLGVTLVEIISKCNGIIISKGELKTVIAS